MLQLFKYMVSVNI